VSFQLFYITQYKCSLYPTDLQEIVIDISERRDIDDFQFLCLYLEVQAAMKTRHLETDQWLNRKEWCLGSGRRRQLLQDRKDR
jgi:hypothetical protein